MSASYNIKKIEINGKKINYAVTGKGRQLIFIHGWSNNWGGWKALANYLSRHYELCLLDLPGFGDSESIETANLDNLTDNLYLFLKKTKKKPLGIIGASMGSLIAANLLKKHPKSTQNLVLIGAMFSKLSVNKHAKSAFDKILYASTKSKIIEKMLQETVRSRYTGYAIEKLFCAYKFNKKMIDKYSIPGRKRVMGKAYAQLGL